MELPELPDLAEQLLFEASWLRQDHSHRDPEWMRRRLEETSSLMVEAAKSMRAYAAAAVEAERERCAKLVETLRPCGRGDCDDVAAAIRAKA